MKTDAHPRLLAARIIDDVTNGCSLSDRLEPTLKSIQDVRDRAFVQAVCYGVCRFYSRLDIILSHLLQKPMKAKDSDVHALLLVGLYQLMDMRVPSHAAVSETVNAAEKLKKSWARGLINAVLREYLRHQERIAEKIKHDPESEYAHPSWWIEKIQQAWPDHGQAILLANNVHPPMALRVNTRQSTREEYLAVLHEKNLMAKEIPETANGIILESPMSVEALPGFSEGKVSVQDGAAQLAAPLLNLQPGLRVLDACAAPGGKLMHILEIEPNLGALVAVEKEGERVAAIKENLARLRLNAQCICHDVGDVSGWWDGQLFDRILLDAPCSGSGVIRRHPDIKLLRQATDIPKLAEEQLRLLQALWPLLTPHGQLLYVTCSIFPEENEEVLRKFLVTQQDAHEEKIHARWGLSREIGRQILPGMYEMDGFYYACLRKV